MEQPFTRLRTELQQLHALSDKQCYREIMRTQSLGDKKPSRFLHRMQCLIGDRVEFTFFQEMFLKKLPPIVQTVLVAMPNTNTLDQLTAVADRMMETCAAQLSIARTSARTSPSPPAMDSTLTQTVQALQQKLRELRLEICTHRRSRGHSPSLICSHPSSPAHADNPELCWYHATFGERAKRCCSPCKMLGNSHASE